MALVRYATPPALTDCRIYHSIELRLVFRCDYCDAQPDRDTQRTLEGQLCWTAGSARTRHSGPTGLSSLDEREIADLLAGAGLRRRRKTEPKTFARSYERRYDRSHGRRG